MWCRPKIRNRDALQLPEISVQRPALLLSALGAGTSRPHHDGFAYLLFRQLRINVCALRYLLF